MVRGPQKVTLEDALAPLLRQRFDLFLYYVFRELKGAATFVPGWHLDAIEHQLQRMYAGEFNDLIVTLPPRHLKSIIISVAWVAWMLGRHPETKFSCASYASTLAEKHARDCLRVIESAWYRKVFPNMRLTKRAVEEIETYAGGGRLSTSVGGAFTGMGGDWVIIDDPMNGDHALSEVMRDNTFNWFMGTARQRGDDDKTKYIVVMQRLHEDDLAGQLLRQGGWEELRLPAIATQDELIPLTRGRFHQRRAGHPLCPRRQSLAYLERRRAQEPYVFAAQYQQDPVGRIGAFVMPEWFGTYDDPPITGTVTLSLDTAVDTTVRSDWSVGIVARFYQGRYYVLDVWRDKVVFGDLLANVRRLTTEYRVGRLLIEKASSGQQLIQQLTAACGPGDPLPQGIKPTDGKIVRFEAQANRIEAGQVVLPRAAPWLADFVQEVSRFPGGSHDDQADALAQLLANPPIEIDDVNAAPIMIDVSRPASYLQYMSDGDPWASV